MLYLPRLSGLPSLYGGGTQFTLWIMGLCGYLFAVRVGRKPSAEMAASLSFAHAERAALLWLTLVGALVAASLILMWRLLGSSVGVQHVYRLALYELAAVCCLYCGLWKSASKTLSVPILSVVILLASVTDTLAFEMYRLVNSLEIDFLLGAAPLLLVAIGIIVRNKARRSWEEAEERVPAD
jgi:hypothetical protein